MTSSFTLSCSWCFSQLLVNSLTSCRSWLSTSWYQDNFAWWSATSFWREATSLLCSCSRAIKLRSCSLFIALSCWISFSCLEICCEFLVLATWACCSCLLSEVMVDSLSVISSDCCSIISFCSCTRVSFSLTSSTASSFCFLNCEHFSVNPCISSAKALILSPIAAFVSITVAKLDFSSLSLFTWFSKPTIWSFRLFFSSSMTSKFSLNFFSSASFWTWWALTRSDTYSFSSLISVFFRDNSLSCSSSFCFISSFSISKSWYLVLLYVASSSKPSKAPLSSLIFSSFNCKISRTFWSFVSFFSFSLAITILTTELRSGCEDCNLRQRFQTKSLSALHWVSSSCKARFSDIRSFTFNLSRPSITNWENFSS